MGPLGQKKIARSGSLHVVKWRFFLPVYGGQCVDLLKIHTKNDGTLRQSPR